MKLLPVLKINMIFFLFKFFFVICKNIYINTQFWTQKKLNLDSYVREYEDDLNTQIKNEFKEFKLENEVNKKCFNVRFLNFFDDLSK